MKISYIAIGALFLFSMLNGLAQEKVAIEGNSLVAAVQLFPDQEPNGYRGKALKVFFKEPLKQGRKLRYTMHFTSKSGHVFEHAGSFHTSYTSDEPKDFQLVNLYLSIGRHDPPEKRVKLKSEIVPGNIKEMKLVVKETKTGLLSSKTTTIVSHTFQNLYSNPNKANKSCHPNPTALVGNWLTGRGNVVEIVKVR